MNKLKKSVVIFLLSLTLPGCSFFSGPNGIFKNRDTDYLQAKSVAPLRIPPGIATAKIQAHYPAPQMTYVGNARPDSNKVSLIPPELNTTSN